ncbi:DUF6059 family protein [Kitasatospora sp. NPDC004799]|uniref:DUF6059 family protein n=1 Tax=Kitasatospora sp. NPDC004799 TaxID=3154460 RepID=UPI0033B62EDC
MGARERRRAAARRLAVGWVRALANLGAMFGAVTVEYHLTLGREPRPAPLEEPPADHPERLVPGVPPSARERELWAQLEGLHRRG